MDGRPRVRSSARVASCDRRPWLAAAGSKQWTDVGRGSVSAHMSPAEAEPAGRPAGCRSSVGRSVGRSIFRSRCLSVGQLVFRLVDRRIGWVVFIGRSIGRAIRQSVGRSIGWSVGRLVGRSDYIDWSYLSIGSVDAPSVAQLRRQIRSGPLLPPCCQARRSVNTLQAGVPYRLSHGARASTSC